MVILSSESGVSESAGEQEGCLEDVSEVSSSVSQASEPGTSAAIFLLASSNKMFCRSLRLVLLDLFLCFFLFSFAPDSLSGLKTRCCSRPSPIVDPVQTRLLSSSKPDC